MALFITLIICLIVVHRAENLGIENFKAEVCDIASDDITYSGKSYDDCVKLCNASPDCVAINFIQKMSLCRTNFQSTTTTKCPGYVYSRKENWKKKSDCSCSPGQECGTDGQCQASGCQVPPKPGNGITFGTQRNIGKRVAIACNLGYVLTGARTRSCQRDGTWSGEETDCIPKQCEGYLVSGANEVGDDQLTASSYWCQSTSFRTYCTANPLGKSAIYGRINSRGTITGCWSPNGDDKNPYIEVDFRQLKLITGIALKGRDPTSNFNQFVTAFKVIHSHDCVNFIYVQDEDGNAKVFEGNTEPDVMVVRMLPERKLAKCVRVYPVGNSGGIALRFDVIGCQP